MENKSHYETLFVSLLSSPPRSWPVPTQIAVDTALDHRIHGKLESFLDYSKVLPAISKDREAFMETLLLVLFAGITPRPSKNIPDPSKECLAAARIFAEILEHHVQTPLPPAILDPLVKALNIIGTAIKGHLVCNPIAGGTAMGIGLSITGNLILKAMGIIEMMEAVSKAMATYGAGYIPQEPQKEFGKCQVSAFDSPMNVIKVGGFDFTFTSFSQN